MLLVCFTGKPIMVAERTAKGSVLSLSARWLWQQWYPGIHIHVAFLIPPSVCSVNEVLFSLKAQFPPIFWHMEAVQLPQVAKAKTFWASCQRTHWTGFLQAKISWICLVLVFCFFYSLKLWYCSIKTCVLWVSVRHLLWESWTGMLFWYMHPIN